MKRVLFPSLTSLLVAVVLIVQGGCSGGNQEAVPPAARESQPPRPPATETAPTDRSQMELLETKQSATQSTIDIVGQVKNVSTREVSGVTVYCDFQDASGKSVRVVQGHLEIDPLAPNKISQFRVSTPASAAIKRFNVTFAEMFGGKLVTKDSRK